MRVLLRFAYDGTGFRGWQVQPGLPTVQQTIQDALAKLCGRPFVIHGAGRTDAGVHALSMPAHVDIAPDELEMVGGGLNRYLPPSVRCISAAPVADDFSSRFDAVSRSYRYRIGRSKDPLRRLYEYQPDNPRLNTELMDRAASLSIGEGSWRGFAMEGSGNATWVMSVSSAQVAEDLQGWELRITANRFLRGVVRIWSGTLYRIGTGRIPPETVMEILAGEDRAKAGPSLPPGGLTLMDVEYEDEA